MKTPEEYMDAILAKAQDETNLPSIDKAHVKYLENILACAETQKGVLAVIITSIVYKALHPEQDIRHHQTSMVNGYSGRTFDTSHVTPYMKAKEFPAMSSSGWLTRSLDQKMPYDLSYPGAISGRQNGISLKESFLYVIDKIQNENLGEPFLAYIFHGLLKIRESHRVELIKPRNLSISSIMKLLDTHIESGYHAEGASRLPVLAIYAIYQSLLREHARYSGMVLLPLESHTSADAQSGRIGDIEILREDGSHFEALEIKHKISISPQMILDAYKKFGHTKVERYYSLSTAAHSEDECGITAETAKIKNSHGCQVIVNGVMPSICYYLRLLSNTDEFIDNYVALIASDKALKFEHKQKWNSINAELKN